MENRETRRRRAALHKQRHDIRTLPTGAAVSSSVDEVINDPGIGHNSSSAFAHGIEDLVDQGQLGRTTIFGAIREGQLKAKKYGRRTIVLDEDWRQFLATLPDARAHQERSAA